MERLTARAFASWGWIPKRLPCWRSTAAAAGDQPGDEPPALTEPEQVARLHFLDCAAPAHLRRLQGQNPHRRGHRGGLPRTGAEDPGATLSLTLLDSLGKRGDLPGGDGGRPWACPASPASTPGGRRPPTPRRLREQFDFRRRPGGGGPAAAVRAVPALCEGWAGSSCHERTRLRRGDLRRRTGCQGPGRRAAPPSHSYTIPGTDVTHRVVVAEKVSPTPLPIPAGGQKCRNLPSDPGQIGANR